MTLSSLIQTRFFKFGLHAFKFAASGIPMLVVGVFINRGMVEWLLWPKWLSYAITLYIQATVNFFICRWFVFTPSKTKTMWEQYVSFLGVIAIFRFFDWGFYTILVNTTSIHYIIVQVGNAIFFSLAKFYFSKRAFEGGKGA